jgi:hypothetical protein
MAVVVRTARGESEVKRRASEGWRGKEDTRWRERARIVIDKIK